MQSTNLDYALKYLKHGFSIFPVHAPGMPISEKLKDRVGKLPLVKWDPFQEAPPTEQQVKKWWTRDFHRANIGLATGKVSGCFVVDADGERGRDFITERFGGFPDTLTSYTKKGMHFYFKHPGWDVENKIRIAEDVDIRGDGGYTVLPPSRHESGQVYDWSDWDSEILEAPPWLLDFIKEHQSKSGKTRLSPHELQELLKGAPQGQRHNALIKLAGHWIGIGLPLKEVELLSLAWNKGNHPPGADDDVLTRVRNLWETHQRKRLAPDGPTISREGDGFRFVWPDAGIKAELRYIREISDGLQGELKIQDMRDRTLHWGRLKLASQSQRDELVKKLKKQKGSGDLNWGEILQQFSMLATEEYRKGEPVVELVPSEVSEVRYLIDKLLPEKETSVLYADGGSGKSTIGLAIGVAAATGTPLPGNLKPRRHTAVLYLDWESCREEHTERLTALLRGMGLDFESVSGSIFYRPMVRPVYEDIVQIKADVARLGIGLVIADSYGPAAGIEAEGSEAAIRVMNALRELSPATRLLITHVSKADANNSNGGATPYGSVYVRNLARSAWFLKCSSEEEAQSVTVGLFHKKANRGGLNAPIGLIMEYDRDETDRLRSLRLKTADISRIPELSRSGSLRTAIKGLLVSGAHTLDEVAQTLEKNRGSVKTTLYRMRDDGEADHRRQGDRDEWFILSNAAEPL